MAILINTLSRFIRKRIQSVGQNWHNSGTRRGIVYYYASPLRPPVTPDALAEYSAMKEGCRGCRYQLTFTREAPIHRSQLEKCLESAGESFMHVANTLSCFCC
jgi:hypothetical protein